MTQNKQNSIYEEFINKIKKIESFYEQHKNSDSKSYDMVSNKNDHFPNGHHFKELNCNLEVLNNGSDEFIILEKFVKNLYRSNLHFDVKKIFKVQTKQNFVDTNDMNLERRLLFHGTPVANYLKILQNGLRVSHKSYNDPDFGKCLYFTDHTAKSLFFCGNIDPETERRPMINEGLCLLLICDVITGKSFEIKNRSEVKTTLSKAYHSFKACGRKIRDPRATDQINGSIVANGILDEPLDKSDNCFNKDEYIIYDSNQCNISYIAFIEKF